MSETENKAVVERLWNEVVGQGNLAVVDQIIDPDFTVELAPDVVWSDDLVFPFTWDTGTVGPEEDELRGPDGIKRYVKALHEDLQNIRVHIHEQLVAEEGRIVSRWSAQGRSKAGEGTETSEPSTEDSVTTAGISIYSFAGGKISKETSIIKQLIVTPIPEEGQTRIFSYYGGRISEKISIIKQLIATPKITLDMSMGGGIGSHIGVWFKRK
jgi:hypothetical protein